MKTVKEVSILSGVSVRTLHHYDKIGLFPPTALSEAGYRLYDDEALIRLQEILLFRELEFPLKDIKYLLEQAKEERQDLLAQQIKLLEWKRSHLEQVITHAKRLQEKGDDYMNFDVYNKTELEQLQAEAKEKWGQTAAYKEFAQIHTVTALEAAQRIGFPEARILIANIVVDLALSPKSNSAYLAMDAALADLRRSGNLPIPRHLRDGHYSGSKTLGNARDYKYPHAYPEKWVKQQYLPDKLVGHNYFEANETGKYERALGSNKERIDKLSD